MGSARLVFRLSRITPAIFDSRERTPATRHFHDADDVVLLYERIIEEAESIGANGQARARCDAR